jgi:ferredoxin-NADP reductase
VNAVLRETAIIAPETRHCRFDIPELASFPFLPGQFVSLSAPINGRQITRAYSICSSPAGNHFEICFNRVQDGRFSPFLYDLQPGDSVGAKGPHGYFTVKNPDSPILMIATGTGVAPFRSMLLHLLGEGAAASIMLLFGVRYEEGILYGNEFEQLQRRHPNFRFWPTLTRPKETWNGRAGRVQAHLEEALATPGLDVYICGLNAMVKDVRGILKERGLERSRVFYERYD